MQFKSQRDGFEYLVFLNTKKHIPTGVHFTHEEVEEIITLLRAIEIQDKDYKRTI